MTRTLVVGDTIAGRYQLRAELGRGGMGAVFHAVDTSSGHDVAVKVMKPGSDDLEFVARFIREQTLSRIASPHIVRVLDHGNDDDVLYLVMELVRGVSLRERLAAGDPLPVAEALVVARDVARALAAAHADGVVHRDIKPANVIWCTDDTPRAVLVDFGIARSLDPTSTMTSSGLVIGTPGYIAPEVALGGRRFDARADLYSLGVMLYEMLVGAPPFVAANALALAARQASEDPLSPRRREPAVPADVDAFVMMLLARNPARRPGSAAVVVEALEALLDGRAPGTLLDTIEGGVIDESPYVRIEWDPATRLVRFTRSDVAFVAVEEVGRAYSVIRDAFALPERADKSLLMDLRKAPMRTEPRFSRIVASELPVVCAGWRRMATLVQTAEGAAQIAQLRAVAGTAGSTFHDEAAALAWLTSP